MNETKLLMQMIKNGELEPVTPEYLAKLKLSVGHAIYPVGNITFLVDGSLEDTWDIEWLADELSQSDIRQKLYIDESGMLLLVPNEQGWNLSAGCVNIINPTSDDSFSNFFDVYCFSNEYALDGNRYAAFYIIRNNYDPEALEAHAEDEAQTTLDPNGQFVDIVIDYTTLG